MTRDFDLVLFGATGFTGRLTARYLARRAGAEGVRLAIAGRSREKLASLAAELRADGAGDREPGVVEADTDDQASLAAMARRAAVVATTAGPFAVHGEPVVRACIEAGSDFLDITGEPAYVAGLVARHDPAARRAGARVVSCCGFDSIPADLGTLFTVSQLPAGARKTVECFIKTSGQASGGTWASLVQAFASARWVDELRALREPGRLPPRVRWRSEVNGWAVPLPLVDVAIVRRSSRARWEYGPDFTYAQYVRLRSLPKVAKLLGGALGVFALSRLGPTRRLLLSLRPSGEGPSEAVRARSFFEVTLVGTADSGERVVTRISGGDPGYDETAKMLGEAALCAVATRRRAPVTGGVLTPAEAFGPELIERLVRAGIRFEVVLAG